MQEYKMYMCPNCEGHFHVIWPEPLPNHYHLCSKIKIKCPDCQVVTEIFSPRPEPDPDARNYYWQKVWSCREARYRTTYRTSAAGVGEISVEVPCRLNNQFSKTRSKY